MNKTEKLLTGILCVLMLIIVLDVVFYIGVRGAIMNSLPSQGSTMEKARTENAGPQKSPNGGNSEGLFACDSLPKLLRLSQPKYPEEMRKNGIEGANVMRLLVDEQGQVKEVSIMESAGLRAFDEAAMIAAIQSLFLPGKLNNKSVSCYVSIPFKFALQDKKPKE
jgi:TonB family protein